MRFIADSEQGVVVNEHSNIHPSILERYYGRDNDGPDARQVDQTGAGHPADEDEEDREDSLDGHIADDQEHHIRHEAVPVPEHSSPFRSKETEDFFVKSLVELRSQQIVPEGFMLTPASDVPGRACKPKPAQARPNLARPGPSPAQFSLRAWARAEDMQSPSLARKPGLGGGSRSADI